MAQRTKRPTRAQIARIAEKQPALLNLLVAYFVMEWQTVRIGNPPHGVDQCGITCLVPDYCHIWQTEMVSGIDECVYYLNKSPEKRDIDGPGYISTWLDEIAYPEG